MTTPIGPCEIWAGPTLKGYGRARSGELAHRHSYRLAKGEIPAGLELDHVCKTPLCVNPDHLEPVTREENMRRRYATYTHCANGHEYTEANTYRRPNGHRDCRTCIRDRVRSYKERRAARTAQDLLGQLEATRQADESARSRLPMGGAS